MSADNPSPVDSGTSKFLGWIAFAVIAALYLFVSAEAAARAAGLFLTVGTGISYLKGEKVAYGWAGQEPSGYLNGWFATLFYLIFILLGLAIAFWPEVAVDILGWTDA